VNYCDSVPVHFAISESLNWYRVTTQLRCGGMFNNHFITNFPQNAAVKKWKSVNIWQRYGHKVVAFFLSHPVYLLLNCLLMCREMCL